MSAKPELATSYAALILVDEGLAITPEKLQALITAAGITDVEPIWSTLFANALEGKDVQALLTDVSDVIAPKTRENSHGPGHDADKDPEKVPEKPEEQPRQEDDGDSDSDIGMGLFDD